MKKKIYMSLALAALISCGRVQAEEIIQNNAIPTMGEVVVTATKTDEQRRDVSNAVILKDEYEIIESSAQSVGELLANEPGIDWRTRGNYGGAAEEIRIRGMNADGTQLLVNGTVVNSPSIGSADVGKIALNNIERIEVVKGSGSLLYGTGAMGGTISIFTKRPEKSIIDLSASIGYGTNNSYEILAEQGMYVSDYVGYYLTASKYETNGFRNNGDSDQNNLSFNLVYDKGKTLDISLYGDYLKRDYGLPGVTPPEGTEDFYVNGVKLYDKESDNLLNNGADEDINLVFRLQSNSSERLALNMKGSYMDSESYNENRYYTTWPAVGLPGSKTWVTNKVLAFEVNADMQAMDALTFLVGGEYKKYDWENTQIPLEGNGNEVVTSQTSSSEDLHTLGLFAEGQYQPSQYAKLIAGVRREEHSEFGTEYVPRFGLIVTPHPDTAIKFNYGGHYNAPTPNDLFWPFEDWGFGMGAQGNADLRPETGKHMDATIEQSLLAEKWFTSASIFRWDIKDKIRWAPDAFYFYRPENLDSYEGTGLEVGTAIGSFAGFSMALGYTYSDIEEEKQGGVSRQAIYTAKHYFKSDLKYFYNTGFNMTATARYTGERPGYYRLDTDIEPEVVLPSYWTVDLKLQQRLIDHWLLSLIGKNLFDEKYDTFVQSFRNQDTGVTTMEGYPGAGRSIFFTVKYEY